MEKHIALLRGINVGGKNKIPMAQLKQAFEQAGFSEVSTYINSGNVLFTSESSSTAALQQRCQQAILDTFQLDIPVAVVSAKDYFEAMEHVPEWWGEKSETKHVAIFVIAPATADALVDEVGARPEYERVAHHGNVIFWSAPLKTFSRTRWSKVVASAAYSSITIRNANTTRKLLQLLK